MILLNNKKIYKKNLWFTCLLHIVSIHLFAQIDPGKDFDLQRYIDKAITNGKKEITIPAGRYRVTPKGNRHLLLKDLKDITIVADGVELICTETVQAINIVNCKNIKIV
ncbi:MAG TPA: hypothetical protein PKD85_11460, partial [Saprospiraceae bacterium]|nr:hypothetical protein [Saprospiraceae bacterium]